MTTSQCSVLSAFDRKDFDGHTDFPSLTAEQRLLWLSGCARFAVAAKMNVGNRIHRVRRANPAARSRKREHRHQGKKTG